MVTFAEIINRAYTGPYYSESDYDLKVFAPKITELVKEYEIKCDPDNVLTLDDDLADRVFEAGVKLYTNVGTYCVDSQRIIQFTENEIREALATAPSYPVFGEGKEARALVARKPESDILPWCNLGAGGTAVSSEAIFESVMRGYGQIPYTNSLTAPSLTTLDGVTVRAGSPLEILACIKSVILLREGLRKAGRPGLPVLNSIATAASDQGKIAGSQFGLRLSDGWLIGAMAEMKVNFERLNEIAYVTSLGGHIVGETMPVLGGYCGGPEGTAITSVAGHIQAILVFRASCQHHGPVHIIHSINSSKMALGSISLSTQAISRNSHFPFFNAAVIGAGPETEMALYEIAAHVVTSVVSGSSVWTSGGTKHANIDHISPLISQMTGEVAHAAAGMKRTEANEIVKKLLSRYENNLDDPPKGKRYQDCHDIKTSEPSKDYRVLYEKIKKELFDYGLKFKY